MTNTAQKTVTNALENDVKALLRTIDSFTLLLNRETAALRKSDVKTMSSLQEEKKNMAEAYQAQIMSLIAQKEEMTNIDADLKAALNSARDAFTKVLTDNMNALERARSTTRRLIDRLLTAARKHVRLETPTPYSEAGVAETYRGASLAISLDRSL